MEKTIEGVVIETCNGKVKVRTSIHSDCENCGVCPGSNAMIIDTVDEVGVEAGQRVLVESKEDNMLLAAFMIYMVPLLVTALGVGLGYYLAIRLLISSTVGMTLGGIVFGVAAIYLVRRVDKSMQAETPKIIKKID